MFPLRPSRAAGHPEWALGSSGIFVLQPASSRSDVDLILLLFMLCAGGRQRGGSVTNEELIVCHPKTCCHLVELSATPREISLETNAPSSIPGSLLQYRTPLGRVQPVA